MKAIKRSHFLVAILILGVFVAWGAAQEEQDSAQEEQDAAENHKKILREKDEKIEKLENRIVVLMAPGEGDLKEQLAACEVLVVNQNRLIEGLEKQLGECGAELKKCKTRPGQPKIQ
jgi:hypothetical protein